jgi:hypothetical protein
MTEPLTLVEYQPAEDSGILLSPGTADEAWVRGVNSLKVPTFSRNTLDVSEFRREFDSQVTGGGVFGSVVVSGNFIVGDTTGQDILAAAKRDKTRLTDIRFYINSTDFFAADLGVDLNGGFEVAKWDIGAADKNGIYPFEGELVVTGYYAFLPANPTPTAAIWETMAITKGFIHDRPQLHPVLDVPPPPPPP